MCVVVGAGALAAGGAVAGGVISSNASKSAARAAQEGSDQAVNEQRRQFDITQQNQAPWLQAGQNALTQLSDPNKNFSASPDFQFRRDQGLQGIERTAAARGGAFSGNALKALNEYNSNLASGEFGNWWNRQAGLAGVGQTAANTLATTGANTANNIGNALMQGGDARASGIMGAANGIVGSINNGLNLGLRYGSGGYGSNGLYGDSALMGARRAPGWYGGNLPSAGQPSAQSIYG